MLAKTVLAYSHLGTLETGPSGNLASWHHGTAARWHLSACLLCTRARSAHRVSVALNKSTPTPGHFTYPLKLSCYIVALAVAVALALAIAIAIVIAIAVPIDIAACVAP